MEQQNRKKTVVRIFALATLLTALVFLWLSGVLSPFSPAVHIGREAFAISNYHFFNEHWKEEKLAQLRDSENFKNLTGSSEWDFLQALCDWTHRQWRWSTPDPYPLCNGIDILRDIRAGKTGGFCGQYGYVLADVLKSMGFFHVRYVELWSNKGAGRSHFVVEVWSDQWEKWVVLDADYNMFYEISSSRVPANALEIRSSLFGGPAVAEKPTRPGGIIRSGHGIDLYANFAVSLRSDLMRHNKPLTVGDRFDMFLFFKDQHTNTSLWGGGEGGAANSGGIPYLQVTTRREDIYYDCNFLRVSYSIDSGSRSVDLEFFTDGSMPHFKHIAYSTDNGAHWNVLPGNKFQVNEEMSSCRGLFVPVNVFGGRGRINQVEIVF